MQFHQEWRRDWPYDATATGPAKVGRPGANSRSGKAGQRWRERVKVVDSQLLVGRNNYSLICISHRFSRTCNAANVVANTPRMRSTCANSILAHWKPPTITRLLPNRSRAIKSVLGHGRCGGTGHCFRSKERQPLASTLDLRLLFVPHGGRGSTGEGHCPSRTSRQNTPPRQFRLESALCHDAERQSS